MSKYRAQVDALKKRIPQPEKQMHIVTVFSDGKRALGMGRGNLLTDAEYSKLSGKIIRIDWGEPYDKGAAREERPGDSGGNQENAERPVQDPQGIDDDTDELRSIVDRIRTRRGEKGNDNGTDA